MVEHFRHLDPVYSNLLAAQRLLGEGVRIEAWDKANAYSRPTHVLRVPGMRRVLPQPQQPSRRNGSLGFNVPGFMYCLPEAACANATANKWPTLILRVNPQPAGWFLSACYWCHIHKGEARCMLKTVRVQLDERTIIGHEQLGQLQLIPCGQPFPELLKAEDVGTGGSAPSSPRYTTSRPNSPVTVASSSRAPAPATPSGGRQSPAPAPQPPRNVINTPPPPSAAALVPVTILDTTPGAAARPATAPPAATPEQDRPNKRPNTGPTGRASVAQELLDSVASLTAQVHLLGERLAVIDAKLDPAIVTINDKLDQMLDSHRKWVEYFWATREEEEEESADEEVAPGAKQASGGGEGVKAAEKATPVATSSKDVNPSTPTKPAASPETKPQV